MEMTRKRIIYTIAVTLIVVFSTTFAVLMTLERTDYRNYLQGEYSKNMYQLLTSIENIRVNLGKSAVAGSREQKIMTFEEIFRYTSMADDKLHSLPLPQETIDKTSKFVSQVGDFCFSLARASSEGRDLTDGEYANIDRLKSQALILQDSLNNVLSDVNQGRVVWGEIRKKASGVLAKTGDNIVNNQFMSIQKQVAQYPTLIYDGPFSDNILEIKPKVYSQSTVSVDQAKDTVYKAIGRDKVQSMEVDTKSSAGNIRIASYRFNVTIKGRGNNTDKVICEVSKNGGRMLYLLDSRAVAGQNIDIQKANLMGQQFLANMGFSNMASTYTLKYDNTAVISYIYNQNNIAVYPDQIKLKIALDDGSILGVESEKYLVAHEDKRNIAAPKITIEEARKKVGKKLDIVSSRLAIVPTETNKEILCYEFSGKYNQDNYIIYINADTGYEQKIIQVLSTPNGQLTM